MTQEFKNRIDLQRRRFARSLLKARVKLSVGTMVYKNGVCACPSDKPNWTYTKGNC